MRLGLRHVPPPGSRKTLDEWKPIMPNLKSLELHGGLSLSYVEQGDASGIPMLLLHGATDS